MTELKISKHLNYVGIFLTFACNLDCPYCINATLLPTPPKGSRRTPLVTPPMSGSQWTEAINRMDLPHDVPITLQGGEPTVHPDFYRILADVRPEYKFDILTNLTFDPQEFVSSVSVSHFVTNKNYPAIRGTYHPSQTDWNTVLTCARVLREYGFPVGVYEIETPASKRDMGSRQLEASRHGVPFFGKQYLNGLEFGMYKYAEGLSRIPQTVMCRSNELLVHPSGRIYQCHGDLYRAVDPVGHILDVDLKIDQRFHKCDHFGFCSETDLKVKRDRLGAPNYTAVEILKSQMPGT